MTFVILAALTIVWVVVLGSYARERMADNRKDSVSSFHSQLSTLQRAQPGTHPLGRRSSTPVGHRSTMPGAAARRRRKNVLLGLLTAALFTVLLAVVATGFFTITLAVLSVVAFTGYVGLLLERQRVITERYAKVHPIASARTGSATGAAAAPPRRVAQATTRPGRVAAVAPRRVAPAAVSANR